MTEKSDAPRGPRQRPGQQAGGRPNAPRPAKPGAPGAAAAAAAAGKATAHKASLKEKAAHELRKFLILFIYLWLLFGLITLSQDVVLRQQGVALTTQGMALINALVLAKFMLVIESLEIGRWLRGRPIAALIAFEAVNCTVLFIVFHIVEHIAIGYFRGEGVSGSIPAMGGGGLLGAFIIGLIVFVALIPFYALKNIGRVIGYDRMREILFRDRRHWRLGGHATDDHRLH